ncbi:hypothetical protein ACNPNW_06205, partial [Acinetobacter sp. AGC35]
NSINDRNESDFIRSEQYVAARRRVLRQFIEALLYEDMVPVHVERQNNDVLIYTIAAQDGQGRPVHYVCEGRQMLAFGRIRLSMEKRVMRIQGEDRKEVEDLAFFLEEIRSSLIEEPRH